MLNKIPEFQLPKIDLSKFKLPEIEMPKLDLSRFEMPSFEMPKIDFSKFQLPKFSMPKLNIGSSESEFPIVQGGMGVGISLSGLASAVSNSGGIGVIAANAIGMIEPDYYENGKEANIRALRKEVRKARKNTDGAIGVNIMVAANDFDDLLMTSIEERVDMVILGAGLPIKGIPVEKLREASVKVIPIVSSARAATLIFRSWKKRYNDIPDAVIVEGPKAGGHLGFKKHEIDDPDFALEKIVPEVVSAVSFFEQDFDRTVPVIAAGGIFTGEDIYKFLKLGAKGVQMGTRFVATDECDADIKFKEAYVNCKSSDDIEIIKSPVGLPGRAVKNSFLKNVEDGQRQKFKCAWRCLEHCDIKNSLYCISSALDNARMGVLEKGFAFAGSNAYRVEKIVSVNDLITSLKTEYELAAAKALYSFKEEYEKLSEKFSRFRDEYGAAVQKVQLLKKEYETLMGEKVSGIKEEYEKSVNRIRDEYNSAAKRIDELKEEISGKFSSVSLVSK